MPSERDSQAQDADRAAERKGDGGTVRRVALWALIGAVVAGSAIIQRRRVRERIRRELLEDE